MKANNLSRMLVMLLGVAGGVVRAEALEEAVARYEALGMPDATGAQYVRVEEGFGQYVSCVFFSYKEGYCGNGWRLPMADGTTNPVICSIFGERIEVPPDAEDCWQPARLARDIFYATEAVERLSPPEYSDNPVGVYLFALQLYRHGEKAQAQNIIDLLEKKGLLKKSDRLAKECLAESHLVTAFHGFARSRDFPAYALALEEIQRTFTNAVSEALADKIGMLLASVRSRAAGEIADVPGLSEEDQEIARKLVGLREPLAPLCYFDFEYPGPRLRGHYPWLLPEAWQGLFPDTEGPVWDLLRKGPAMIPVLVLMKQDRVLVDGLFKSQWGTDRNEPSSRSDVASAMLKAILHDDIFERLSYDEDVFTAARTNEKSLGSRSPDDIAMAYLRALSGEKQAHRPLHAWLVRRAARGVFPDFEAWLLSYPLEEKAKAGDFYWNDGTYVCFELAHDYATARGADAREFVQAVAKRLDAVSKSYSFSSISTFRPEDWDLEKQMEEIKVEERRRLEAIQKQFADWAAALRSLELGPSDSASAQARAEAIAAPLEQALREEIRAYLEELK